MKAVKKRGITGDTLNFVEKLCSPPTAEERVRYKDAAIEFLAKLKLTKEVIAEELRIPLRNIIYISQQHFHIDEDLFVIPNVGLHGTVFYHSEKLSRRVLENAVYQARGRMEKTLQKYHKDSSRREKEFAPALKKNLNRFAKLGCTASPLPGVFEAPGEESVNFMNALPICDLLLTNGTKSEILENAFLQSFEAACPLVKVHMIDLEPGCGMMDFFMTHTSGALHCMTFTHLGSTPPESFNPIRPLNKESIEKWELDQLGQKIVSLIHSYLGDV